MGKGADFERDICKQLSLWWTNDERDDIFWRTAGSGARATMRMKKKKDTANSGGDLGLLDPIGKPFIDVVLGELKKGYTNTKMIKSSGLKEAILKTFQKFTDSPKLIEEIAKVVTKIFAKSRKSGGICALDFIDRIKGVPKLEEWINKARIEMTEHKRQYVMIIFCRNAKDPCVLIEQHFYMEIERIQDEEFAGAEMGIWSGYNHLKIMPFDAFFKWLKPETIIEMNGETI